MPLSNPTNSAKVIPSEQTSRQRPNFIRFLSYVRPYWWMIALAAVGGIIKFTIPLLVPQVTQHFVDNVFLSELDPRAQWREVYTILAGLFALYVVIWVPGTYMRTYFAGKGGSSAVFDLRRDLYDRILRMSASFFKRNRSGSVVSRLISDVELTQNLVGSALTNVWMDSTAVLVVLFFLIRIDVRVTLVALVTFPVYIMLFRYFQNEIRDSTHRIQEGISDMAGNAQEKIAGSAIVHAFTQEKRENNMFRESSDDLFSATMRRVRFRGANNASTGLVTQSAPLLVMLYGGYLVTRGQLSVGQLVAVSMYLRPLYLPLERFSELNVVLSNALAALDRIFSVMDQEPDIQDSPGAAKLKTIRGAVKFQDVAFHYPAASYAPAKDTSTEDAANEDSRNAPTLEDVKLEVQPGQKVAFVGPSGAGKSTLVSLIPRFYDVAEGTISVDGHDIRDVKVKSLRKHIGMVLQTPILFSGSVRDNVRYGKPDATQAELIEACKAANAFDFIRALPRGFDSEVGEGGALLSGGQRQRLTIARAFLKDPTILILDEATSALDSESERLIQDALERLMVGRTTFIIAHRLSTVIGADMIVVMQAGRVVDVGTHNELVARRGLYQNLYQKAAAA
ncbi:MAG: ABC transporter ATP-binding protein [Deinococcota bacterium]